MNFGLGPPDGKSQPAGLWLYLIDYYTSQDQLTFHSLKIMVCGSIGYGGGIDDIRKLYSLLEGKGFSIVNHLLQNKGMDYSGITDFRDKVELSRQIVSQDLKYIEEIDVIIVIANGPSYGAAIEMIIAKKYGKKIILLAKDPVPSPWPIIFSDYRVTDEAELVKLLDQLQNQ